MSRKPYRIGRARTGLGLFATHPIKSRQFIVRYSGKVIPSETADRLERYRRNRFLFELNKQWCIDGTTRRNIARYVNHSCRANAEAVIRRGTKRIDYVAARRIEPGEEITVDYGKQYTGLFLEEGGCQCAPCRKRRAKKRRERREAAAKKKVFQKRSRPKTRSRRKR
jgi:hypothetical protein